MSDAGFSWQLEISILNYYYYISICDLSITVISLILLECLWPLFSLFMVICFQAAFVFATYLRHWVKVYTCYSTTTSAHLLTSVTTTNNLKLKLSLLRLVCLSSHVIFLIRPFALFNLISLLSSLDMPPTFFYLLEQATCSICKGLLREDHTKACFWVIVKWTFVSQIPAAGLGPLKTAKAGNTTIYFGVCPCSAPLVNPLYRHYSQVLSLLLQKMRCFLFAFCEFKSAH